MWNKISKHHLSNGALKLIFFFYRSDLYNMYLSPPPPPPHPGTWGGGYVAVDLVYVLPIFCGGSVFVFVWCSFFLRMSWYCIYSVALPYGAVGWSAVCYYGISWSYLLTFLFSCRLLKTHTHIHCIYMYFARDCKHILKMLERYAVLYKSEN